MKKVIYVLLVILLVLAFCASGLYLGSYFLEGKREADRYNELSGMIGTDRPEHTQPTETEAQPTEEPTTAPTQAAAQVNPDFNPFGEPGEGGENAYFTPDVVDEPELVFDRPEQELTNGNDLLPWYMDLHEQNRDMIGWIQIENTKINYPVMQTRLENANYYLYRNFDGEQSIRGSIYAWEESDVFGPSDNITLFGHNMKDGSMFAALGNYFNKEYWEQNPLVFFDTLTESHTYKIFAVFKTSGNEGEGFAYHKMSDAENEAEFNEFIATCKQLSFYDTGITPVYGDKIICLSTCEYTLNNGRFVVAAVRID